MRNITGDTNIIARIAKWLVAGLVVLLMLDLITGVAVAASQGSLEWGEWHHWAGHLTVRGSWLVFAFSLAAALSRTIARERRWLRLSGVAIGIIALLLVLHTSFTGYLGPSNLPNMDQATRMRFQTVHMVFEPILLTIVLVSWFLLLRRLERIHT